MTRIEAEILADTYSSPSTLTEDDRDAAVLRLQERELSEFSILNREQNTDEDYALYDKVAELLDTLLYGHSYK